MNINSEKTPWLEQPIHPALPGISREAVIFVAIMLVAVVSRLYNLGVRVMSHDESLHTYFSWLLYKGDGYQHNPMMHGPLQFHLIALSYFLFGPTDFSARLPAAFFNLATIALAWKWRRYLGKAGGLIAGVLMVISPIMLFYGRYVREDPYAIFSGVLMLYAVLRYLETARPKYLYLLACTLVLHFIDKETSFIYTAQLLLFLAGYFIYRVTRQAWDNLFAFRAFIVLLSVGILLGAAGGGLLFLNRQTATLGATEVAAPANPTATLSPLQGPSGTPSAGSLLFAIGLVAIVAAGYFLLRGYTWSRVKTERSFDMLILTGTLALPMLAPFALKYLEGQLHVSIPTTASEVQGLTQYEMIVIGIFLVLAYVVSIAIGQLWNRNWWKYALTFWVPFTVFYTTVFTNTDGFFTGVIGSLGYWLVQQGVQRGSQPWYYYIVVLLPIYEFLPLLGAIFAVVLGVRRLRRARREETSAPADLQQDREVPAAGNFPNTFSLLLWWSVISIAAFSIAGEKMPWLTYHLTWPLILLAAWGLGSLIESIDWASLRSNKSALALGAIFVFLTSLGATVVALLGATPPFQGASLDQLQQTAGFVLPAVAVIASGAAIFYLLRDWQPIQAVRSLILVFFGLLAVLTVRTAFRAAYINYDNATEFLVYAHASTAVKDVIRQAAEISQRTTGGMGINLAYDASSPDTGVSWPFVWYLRDFTNQHSFDQPTRALRDSTVVIVDSKNFDKIEQALGPGYYRIDYTRMWWPNQDYFGLVTDRPAAPFDANYSCRGLLSFFRLFPTKDFSRVCSAVLDPNIRAGIIDIWLNRNYSQYAAATGHTDLTLATWQPSDAMRMYIKQDVAQQMWKYGVAPAAQAAQPDPYAGKTLTLSADQVVDSSVITPPMNAPRALAFAPDGTFYVADSRNHRVLHFGADGSFILAWGGPSGNAVNNPNPAAPPSTFNEPWGVAVGPDGSVYVTDTWNYRIQKFSPNGQFIKMWSTYGAAGSSQTFYGPRGITVDSQGHVYVVDTGNKRIVVFDADGNYLTEFGGPGLDPGQFDEPVGIAIDSAGVVYVTDTWNQRIQSFTGSPDGLSFTPLKQWDVVGWNGQSLDNKPFIAADGKGHVFVTDPDAARVIEYTSDGTLVSTWGDFGSSASTFGIAAGIAVDADGHVWVTDAGNQRIMRFTLP